MQSPNFAAGLAGWQITRNGTVEFNSGTFRGTVTAGEFDGTDFIINSSGAFFYSGTPGPGNLIASVVPGSTPVQSDPFGNTVFPGVYSYAGSGFAGIAGAGLTLQDGSFPWQVLVDPPSGLLVLQYPHTGSQLYMQNTGAAASLAPNEPGSLVPETGTLVSVFGAGWAASGSAVNGVWFLLLADGMVYCAVDVKTNSAAPGGTICAIPAGYIPNTNIAAGLVNNPGTPANGAFTVTANSSGSLAISVPGSVSGIRYAGSFTYPGPAYTA